MALVARLLETDVSALSDAARRSRWCMRPCEADGRAGVHGRRRELVMARLRGERSVAELRREHGISESPSRPPTDQAAIVAETYRFGLPN